MPPLLPHPIVSRRSFRRVPEDLSQLRCARCPNVIVLRSSRFSCKTLVVFWKIFRFQILIRGFVALDPLASQFLHQAILMYSVVALHRPFACGELAAIMRISNRSHMRPNCVVGAFPRSRSLSVGSRL